MWILIPEIVTLMSSMSHSFVSKKAICPGNNLVIIILLLSLYFIVPYIDHFFSNR